MMRSCNCVFYSSLFVASALLNLPMLSSNAHAAISPDALSPDSLVSKFSDVLPEGATVTTATRKVANYELLVSAAEKVKRELRTTKTISVTGSQTRTLWQLPAGAELDRVFAEVSEQMAGEELFICSGRDCGRSTAWATLVFAEALVYGQDRNQRYRVVRQSATDLAAVYVIRRGNRRINLLLETLVVGGAEDDSADVSVALTGADAVTMLTKAGFARLTAVPGEDGELDAEALAALTEAGAALSVLPAGTVYVVCHLYSGSDTPQLLVQSEVCAAEAASVLQSAQTQDLNAELQFKGFAAGPLLPREAPGEPRSIGDETPANRIELVQPRQLPQQ